MLVDEHRNGLLFLVTMNGIWCFYNSLSIETKQNSVRFQNKRKIAKIINSCPAQFGLQHNSTSLCVGINKLKSTQRKAFGRAKAHPFFLNGLPKYWDHNIGVHILKGLQNYLNHNMSAHIFMYKWRYISLEHLVLNELPKYWDEIIMLATFWPYGMNTGKSIEFGPTLNLCKRPQSVY